MKRTKAFVKRNLDAVRTFAKKNKLSSNQQQKLINREVQENVGKKVIQNNADDAARAKARRSRTNEDNKNNMLEFEGKMGEMEDRARMKKHFNEMEQASKALTDEAKRWSKLKKRIWNESDSVFSDKQVLRNSPVNGITYSTKIREPASKAIVKKASKNQTKLQARRKARQEARRKAAQKSNPIDDAKKRADQLATMKRHEKIRQKYAKRLAERNKRILQKQAKEKAQREATEKARREAKEATELAEKKRKAAEKSGGAKGC